MRLHSFLPQLLPLFLLAEAALAQNTLQQTCSGLKTLSKCKFEFSVPYGVNVTLKTVPDRKYDECKTKEKYKKPCPTVKNPKAMCDAWKCVSGWVDTTKQVITGLEILTKKVNLCDTVRKLLGQPQGDNFIKSSDAICQCFPRIGELSATSGFKSFELGVLSTADSKDVDQVVKAQKVSSASADLFRGGEIQTVQDLFKFVPIVDRTFLLQRKIGSIVDFYAGYSAENRDLVSSTFNSLANVSSSSSAAVEEELIDKERPANDDLLQQIIIMKTVLKRDLYDPLLAMKQAFKRYNDQIAKSSFGPGKAGVVMEPSAIGYQRWTKIPKMAMPCSKQVTKTFNKSGFSKTFSFTEYYKCTVDGATAYYPKLQSLTSG